MSFIYFIRVLTFPLIIYHPTLHPFSSGRHISLLCKVCETVKLHVNIVGQTLKSYEDFPCPGSQGARPNPVSVHAFVFPRTAIMWDKIRTRLMSGTLLQDALAIVKFPQMNDVAKDQQSLQQQQQQQQHIAHVNAHLSAWGAKKLPVNFDVATMKQIDSLFYQIWLYSEDYLRKATSTYLPDAYSHIPCWAHADFQSEASRLFRLNHYTNFRLDDLSDATCQRLLQAFLRYELLCKVYGHHAPVEDQAMEIHTEQPLQARPEFANSVTAGHSFQVWDWRLLARYEDQHLNGTNEADIRLLCCVREYVVTLYGALFAQQMQRIDEPSKMHGNWEKYPHFEPAPCHEAPRPYATNPNCSWGKLEFMKRAEALLALRRRDWDEANFLWCDVVISVMSSVGFTLLTKTLTSTEGEFHNTLWALCHEFCQSPPQIDAISVHRPKNADSPYYRWYPNAFDRLHRQRAWALFSEDGGSDRRPGPPLPTPEEFRENCGRPSSLEPWLEWEIEGSEAPNEYIAHGKGVMMYHSLAGKAVPFWRSEG